MEPLCRNKLFKIFYNNVQIYLLMSTVLNIYKRVWHKYSTCLHKNQIEIIIFTSHKMLACEEVVVWEIFSSILFMLYYFLLNRNFICTFLWCPEMRSFLYSKIIFEIHSRISNNNIDNSRWCVVAFCIDFVYECEK